MPDPDISSDQTGTINTKTKWEAVELTRNGGGLRIGIPEFTVTTLPDGSKIRQSIGAFASDTDSLSHDAEFVQFLDLADKIAKRIMRGDLKPQS